jgi:hypothetical protein
MPDDTIRVGTTVDLSGLNSGMSAAVETVKRSMSQLKAEFRSAQAALTQATADLAEAQAQLGAAAAAGNQQAIEIIGQYEAPVQAAAASMKELQAAILQESAAANEAAASTQRMTGSIVEARAAAQLLSRDLGVRLPFAITGLMSRSEALAPLLRAALPVGIAVFFGEALARIVDKTWDWATGLDVVKEDLKTIGKVQEDAAKQVERLTANTKQAQLEIVGIVGGKGAEDAARGGILSRAVATDQASLKSLDAQLSSIQSRISTIRPPEPQTKVGKGGAEYSVTAVDTNVAARHELENEMKQINAQIAVDQAKLTNDMTNAAKEQAAAAKSTSEEQQLASKKAEQALKEQERYLDAHNAEILREQNEAIEAERKATDQQLKLRADLLRGIAGYNRALEDEEKRATEERNRQFADSIRKQQTDLKEQIESEKDLLKASHEAAMSGLDSGSRGPSLNKSLGVASPTENLDRMKAMHQAELAETQSYYAQLARIAAASDNPAEVAKVEAERVAAVGKANQQIIQDQERLRDQQLAVFRQMTDGFNSAVRQWVITGQGFGRDMRNVFAGMLADLMVNLIKMAEQWVVHEVVTLATHVAGNQAKVASDAAAAAQSRAITSATTLQQVTANAVKAATGAYGAVAAIPIIGPVLAPIAAAGAFAGVEAIGAVGAFEMGGIVPNTGLHLLHANEMVLPRQISQNVQNMTERGGGGGNQLNYTANYHNISDKQFLSLATKHGSTIAGIIRQHARRQNLG